MATNEEKIRCRALHVIYKYSKCENFDTCVPYLAMTYYDRFISSRKLVPIVMDTVLEHDVELLALCCLILAWKMRTISFKINEFRKNQPGLKYIAKEQFLTMEDHILKGLDYRLSAKTALCFVPDFASKYYWSIGCSQRTINEIIIQSQDSTLVSKLEPSVIAASAFLAASKYLYPDKYQSFYSQLMRDGMFKLRHEERCIEYMIKLCRDLKLVIENDDLPKRWVIAGEEPEQGTAETLEKGAAETSERGLATELNFPLRWRICKVYGEKFAVFRPLSESAELNQLADQEASETRS